MIPRDEAVQKTAETVSQQADVIEESVDARIELARSLGICNEIKFKFPPSTPATVRNEIKRRYEENGWITKSVEDQRDGDSITLYSEIAH